MQKVRLQSFLATCRMPSLGAGFVFGWSERLTSIIPFLLTFLAVWWLYRLGRGKDEEAKYYFKLTLGIALVAAL